MSDIIIKNIDGLELLRQQADNSIDLILTDPPYHISRKTGFKASKGKKTIERFKVDYEFGKWDEGKENLLPFVEEFYRVLKPGGTCIIFYDLWKITYLQEILNAAKFKQIRFIEWLKTNPVPINSKINYLTNCREIALLGVKKGKPTFHSKYDKGVYEYPIYHGKDRFHPTQKSLKLFEDLVKKHSNENDLVLDCFLGSATTALACKNTNRRFVGTEADENYYKKSVERLK